MRVMIDACVLYPAVLRGLVLDVAARGRFTPLWSPRILEEWARAAARRGPEAELGARGDIARLRAGWPGAEVIHAPEDEAALDLPDAADLHVLAAAIAGEADLVLTQNMRDFPRRALDRHGVRARRPDDFLMDLWLETPGAVEAAAFAARDAASRETGDERALRPLLKRARLPRLGKALQEPGT